MWHETAALVEEAFSEVQETKEAVADAQEIMKNIHTGHGRNKTLFVLCNAIRGFLSSFASKLCRSFSQTELRLTY